ncbi:MAG: type II toxin-antitoxin system RelE/ParE family toxin [Deltaproteobacteria bacterium]|nr:type II toxin-antitoxin system RelE/ParE family toxin [Deltaproteobacteria bacterium]
MQVIIHPDAVAEAQAAYRWYRERSVSAAGAYLAELDQAVEAIVENPKLWPQYVHGTRRYLFHRFPFYLVYRKIAKKIEIIAVAHGRRKPGYWKSRTS